MERLWKSPESRVARGSIGHPALPTYDGFMEISLAPEIEERLTKTASAAGKAADQVVKDWV